MNQSDELEYHTFTTLERRLGGLASRSTLYGWVDEGKLRPIHLCAKRRQMAFWKFQIEELGIRLMAEKVKKIHKAICARAERTALSDLGNLSDEQLVGTYLKSSGETASQLWPEVSRRYRSNPWYINKLLGESIRQNQSTAAHAPQYANVYNKQNNRTERVRVK